MTDYQASAALQSKMGEIGQFLAFRYPSRKDLVLAFRFGNVVRSIEEYSEITYGLESTVAWPRLLAVMPGSFRELVDGRKSQVDFMLNLWVVWWVLLAEYAVVTALAPRVATVWFPLTAVVAIAWLTGLAQSAAVLWGEMVRAAFDVYLPDLRRALGFAEPASQSAERALWGTVGAWWTYRPPWCESPLAGRRESATELRQATRSG